MTDPKKPSPELPPKDKPTERAQPNKNSRPLPIVGGLENYHSPERK
jgi:hypothetical protein